MPLPVLNIPAGRSDADLLRLFGRIESLWSDSLAQATPLQSGSALTNPSLPNVPAANRMLEGMIPAGSSAEQALVEVAAHFADRGVRCQEWWLNQAQRNDALSATLLAAGYVPRAIEVFVLPSPARPADPIGPQLSVYSARAGLRHARSVIEEMTAQWPHADGETEAMLLHLDDPHYELLLASESGEPVGMVGVFAAGDIGRIERLFVRQNHRGRGVGRLLLNRAIELCVRSRFTDVFLGTPEFFFPHRNLFAAAGFRQVGKAVVYKKVN
jgi:GNAT superfamily N-acetyltransferase